MELPAAYLDLLDAPVNGLLATVMSTGAPQVSPVWFLREGDEILVSSVGGRLRERHVRANPNVSITTWGGPYTSYATGAGGPGLNAYTITAVPEPSSMVLAALGGGLMAIGAIRRRLKRSV